MQIPKAWIVNFWQAMPFLRAARPPIPVRPGPTFTTKIVHSPSKRTALNPDILFAHLMENISPPDARAGCVVAATSRENPPYYFHWVRDAALVMSLLVKKYAKTQSPQEKRICFERLLDYARFSKDNQERQALTGLGEPKFQVNGDPYTGPWGRPQNDGPALRALTLSRFAARLLHEGQTELVRDLLYDGKSPSDSVIKKDLEYVAHHWRENCFDLWEEVQGQHFYTLLCQRRALVEGSKLARVLGDPYAADFYEKQAGEMEPVLATFWNPQKRYIEATKNFSGGLDTKKSGLDVAVILAALHAQGEGMFFSVTDDRILATAFHLIKGFEALYPVNRKGFPAVVLGRYPEDQYYGGNPWVLTTAAMAELCFAAAKKFTREGVIKISSANRSFFDLILKNAKLKELPKLTAGKVILASKPGLFPEEDQNFVKIISALQKMGQDFLDRIAIHSPANLRLSEQIHRDSGYMFSAENLTWSYASVLTALEAKASLLP